MRKLNTILVLLIMVLFIDHIVFGSLHFLGTNLNVTKPFAHAFFSLVFIHAVVSILITIKAEVVGIKTHARYNKENRQFWNRRISGMAIMVLAATHIYLMAHGEDGLPRISKMAKIYGLLLPLLLIFVCIHIYTNVRPLLISLGIRNIEKKEKIIKVLIVLITIVVMFSFAFFILNRIGSGA